jgi:Zn-dependent peptidase ImmA (M78 family)
VRFLVLLAVVLVIWIDPRVSLAEWQEWEGVAREFQNSTGVDDPPVDARMVARRAKLEIRYAIGPSKLDIAKREITVNPRQHPTHVQIDIAHEAGHFLLDRAGLPNVELGAKYLSGALLGPHRCFDREVDSQNWSVVGLQRRHRNMPALALALRITQVRDAVATIFHPLQKRRPWRRASPWIEDLAVIEKPTRLERDFAARAWDVGTELHGEGAEEGLHATVAPDEYSDGPRVIVVRDLRQLALRFIEG